MVQMRPSRHLNFGGIASAGEGRADKKRHGQAPWVPGHALMAANLRRPDEEVFQSIRRNPDHVRLFRVTDKLMA